MALSKISTISLCFATSLIPSISVAEENRVTLPNLDDLVHYTTVTRGEVTEHILTNQTAIDALQNGKPAPDGTHFVLADYRNGEIYRYFVMEKGENWGKDYPAYRRTDDWQFQWFWGDGRINMDENTERCQSCHSSRESNEYTYTYRDLMSFEH